MPAELTATLFINITDSRCGNCRKPTMPSDTHHRDISGWNRRPGGGCGARFINTASDYALVPAERLREMRPDLPVRNDR
ncbi:hypothetical protein [Streptomyces sp. NRRL S-350]|uniref:hypothetical protein n=1 Tax=Streptomyces sp. NRRL S-350 TaxID=1463902 RepID=UPI0004C1C4FC|nr:hypothetical protein [Streptomyces sp. NRRL S-350]